MEDGLLSLKWNNHRSTFFHILSNLRKQQTYTDATLACEGKYFSVHKLVMSTCSDYFGEIFEKTTCKAPVIVLKDIGFNELEALLDYMYLGEVDVKQTDLANLIKAAECLKIKGLAVPDEDPSAPIKRPIHNDRRTSPSSKRLRRESGDNSGSNRQRSTRHRSPPKSSVPSQSSRVEDNSQSSNQSEKDFDVVPIEMIKVEADDSNSNSEHPAHRGTSYKTTDESSELRRNTEDTSRSKLNNHKSKEPPGDDFKNFSNREVDDSNIIQKEECEEIEPYDESDPLAGPSGEGGDGSSIPWSDSEGNFPPNMFDDDPSQQVMFDFADTIHNPENEMKETPTYSVLSDFSPSPFCRDTQRAVRPMFPSAPQHSKAFPPELPPQFMRGKKVLDPMAAAETIRAINISNSTGDYALSLTCPICSKRMSRRDKLREHIRIHTGEAPYHCLICNAYSGCTKSQLDKHIASAHKSL